MKRVVLTFLLAATGLLGAWVTLPATGSAQTVVEPSHVAPQPTNPVIEWNKFLLGIQATAGDQPATVHPTYGWRSCTPRSTTLSSRSTTARCRT